MPAFEKLLKGAASLAHGRAGHVQRRPLDAREPLMTRCFPAACSPAIRRARRASNSPLALRARETRT
eukprot:scaffold73519_cov81-Phaeocystis_antarctica.AAC.1